MPFLRRWNKYNNASLPPFDHPTIVRTIHQNFEPTQEINHLVQALKDLPMRHDLRQWRVNWKA